VLIDWFTVAAQILNFLVLVALLKYFLYNPIIRAMDRREEKVRSRLEEAEKREKESQEEAEKYRQKNQEIEEKRREMLDKAKEEAENHRKELTLKARREVDSLRAKWGESVQREKASFLRELKQMTGRQVYAISRRALRDLADADLQERVVQAFLSKMDKMKKEERQKMAEAVKEEGNKATLRSGFEISSSQRQKITKAFHQKMAGKAEIDYETDPELILGIELKSSGEKLSWSLEGYIKDLEEQSRAALEQESRQEKEAAKDTEDKEETGGEESGEEHTPEQDEVSKKQEAEEGQEETKKKRKSDS